LVSLRLRAEEGVESPESSLRSCPARVWCRAQAKSVTHPEESWGSKAVGLWPSTDRCPLVFRSAGHLPPLLGRQAVWSELEGLASPPSSALAGLRECGAAHPATTLCLRSEAEWAAPSRIGSACTKRRARNRMGGGRASWEQALRLDLGSKDQAEPRAISVRRSHASA
jgi:hypothetical protein